jgi:hypothetical protein
MSKIVLCSGIKKPRGKATYRCIADIGDGFSCRKPADITEHGILCEWHYAEIQRLRDEYA